MGYTEGWVKRVDEGFSHIRAYQRLIQMRSAFKVWWEEVDGEIKYEKACRQHDYNQKRIVLHAWREYTLKESHIRRQDFLINENRLHFKRLMNETDAAVAEMAIMRKMREEKQLNEEAEEQRRQREIRLQIAADRAKVGDN